ncbi:MAG: thiol reductant ABC exporter subunit CydD, partial [Coriobacteriia bacterium]|nr:thiol reductant ABC exporter subunit CydD [Coriobacteriia bacterium]
MFDKALFALPGIRRILVLLGLFAVVQAAAIIGQALTLATALDNLWHAFPIDSQAGWIAGFFGCFLAKQITVTAQDSLLARYAQHQGARLRKELLGASLCGGAGWVRAQGTASVTTAALEGIDQVENYLRVILPKVVGAGAILPATLVATFIMDWPSGIILTMVLPVIVFYMILLGRMAQDRAARQYATYQHLSNHFVDTLRGLPTLKLFGAAKRHAAEVFQVSEEFREATDKTLRVATLSSVVLDLLATLGVAAVAMLLGFRLVDGSLPLFTGLAVLILAPEYFTPLRQFAGDFHASLDGRNALAHILALVDGEGENAPEEAEGSSPIGTWSADSTLELAGISFSYAPDGEHGDAPAALQDVSFEARGFMRVGIVGTSGSGKSTLANVLGGFFTPGQGRISVDGETVPLNALESGAWQSQVLYIPQDPHIFHATLRDNIAFYTPDCTDDDIARAIHVVGLEPLVAELPQGLDTVIGEGGRALSGGQAHRIALARALLDANRRILIFDEPTAHLDIETEYELKERMLPLMEGRLVFFATHRMHWLRDMDHVLVLEGGRIVEQGAPDELRTVAVPRVLRDGGDSWNAIGSSPSQPSADAPGMASEPAAVPDGDVASTPAKRDTWVRPYFRRYRKTLASALALGVASFAFAALLMLTSGYLISGTAEAPGNILYYYLPIAFVQVFGLGKPPLRYFERLQSHDWVFRMTSSLRVRLYKALERDALKPGTRTTGEVLGLVSEDIGHIQNLYLRTMFPLVIGWALLAGCLVVMGIVDPLFALAMLVVLGMAAVALPLFANRANVQRMQARKDMKNRLYDALTDDLIGSSDWVFAGRGSRCVDAHMAQAEEVSRTQARIDRFSRMCDLAMAALMGIAACLIIAWASQRFGGTVGGPANWIAALVLGFFPLVEAFSPLPRAAMDANVHRDSIDRLNAFPDTDDSVDIDEGKPVTALTNDLFIRDVHFSYPGTDKPVLDGVNLTVAAGERVAVLGRSGSGKSTLASLVRGDMRPTQGFIALGGKPTTAFGDGVAALIGVVQQDAYLFDRSIRDNLRIGKPGATDDEIWEALDRVKLGDMTRELPQGLDTIADEAGKRFSGGERHRIALARVLLADTPIILLDEPTVGLDPVTERDVLATMMEATAGRSLVMVTHHLQGIEAFDRVVFLEDGRIELDGTPAQLAAESPRYRTLLAFDG